MKNKTRVYSLAILGLALIINTSWSQNENKTKASFDAVFYDDRY